MRTRFSRALGTVGLITVTGLLGCAHAQPVVTESDAIDGVRSDPDHRGLVVSYTGGMCDVSSRLVLTETSKQIRARVVVTGTDGACAAVGIPRTVSARLSRPIGDRAIRVGDREYIPFDGARLLVPSKLPPGFGARTEEGASDQSTSSPTTWVTTTWITRRFDPALASADETSCRSMRGVIEIRIAPAARDESHGRTRIGSAKIGGATAQAYRLGTSNDPDGWAYVWRIGHTTVDVGTSPGCDGDRSLTRSELLRVARSLRPA